MFLLNPAHAHYYWIASQLHPLLEFRDKTQVPITVNECGAMRFEPGGPFYLEDAAATLDSMGIPQALWLWESTFSEITYTEFALVKGPEYGSRDDHLPNQLSRVIQTNWNGNKIRPSTFHPTVP